MRNSFAFYWFLKCSMSHISFSSLATCRSFCENRSHLWNATLWEFRNQTMKKSVGKRHLVERVLLAGTLERRCPFTLVFQLRLPFWKGAPCWKGNLSWNTRVKKHPAGAPLCQGARGFAHPEPIGVTPLPGSNCGIIWGFPMIKLN